MASWHGGGGHRCIYTIREACFATWVGILLVLVFCVLVDWKGLLEHLRCYFLLIFCENAP